MNKKINNSVSEEDIKKTKEELKAYFISYLFISFFVNLIAMIVIYFLIVKKLVA